MGKKRSLSNVDTAWLHMEDPTNLMMITGVFTLEKPIEFDRLKATIEERFLKFGSFRQKVIEPKLPIGSPHWEEDPNFDISAHLHRVALPAPGDQEMLENMVSDLMSTPLDFSKPLWQFHLIENYGSGCALLARLHHCIADGIALVQVILSMTDNEADAPISFAHIKAEKEEEHHWKPFKLLQPAANAIGLVKRVTETVFHEGIEILSHPSHALELAKIGANTAQALGKLLLLPADSKSIFKGKLGVKKQAAWTKPLSLNEIKTIGKAFEGTVNDVLLTVVTGALRRYLKRKEAFGDILNFRAVIPVNLRQMPVEPELGNHFGLVFLSLPVGLKDPKERLLELKRRMDEIKKSPEAVVAFGILNAIGTIPSEIENIILNIFGAKATAVMTNVPGPREQLYFAGSPIKQLIGWVPQAGKLGLGISIMSYFGEVTLGVAVDNGLISDPKEIIEEFYKEFEDLKTLV